MFKKFHVIDNVHTANQAASEVRQPATSVRKKIEIFFFTEMFLYFKPLEVVLKRLVVYTSNLLRWFSRGWWSTLLASEPGSFRGEAKSLKSREH